MNTLAKDKPSKSLQSLLLLTTKNSQIKAGKNVENI
jgi:hypothetical protein